MGDRHRAAVANLLAEERDDGAVGAQHVSEAGGDELCDGNRNRGLGSEKRGVAAVLGGLDGAVEGLDVDLADALRAAHDIGGIDSLVRRHHHELTDAVLHREVGNDLCAVNIIQDSFRGIVLHHRHMLIGSGMEHVFRPELVEDGIHARFAADSGNHNVRIDMGILLGHHQP